MRTNSIEDMPQKRAGHWHIPKAAALVILIGAAIRLYAFAENPLINSDGFLYIQQAKALYYGLSDAIVRCYKYLSAYPVLIALTYDVWDDWVIAGQSISLLFSILTFFPAYWLVRRFLDEHTSVLTLLALVLMPPFILISRDVMRGPVYWFFSMTGLWLFILQMENSRCRLAFASSLCFMMGAWTRIEGSLFILISVAYLTGGGGEKKWRRLFCFLLPFIALFIVGAIYILHAHVDVMALFKPERILSRPLEFFSRYSELRQNLKLLDRQNLPGFSPYFFPRVRNLVWLIALGTLAVQVIETMFYIFFVLLIFGMIKTLPRLRTDPGLRYLAMTSVFALITLYAQIIYNWAMTSRFVALFLFPALVFMGVGLKETWVFIAGKFRMNALRACVLVGVAIMAITLPKNLSARYVRDKLVFREIGRFISQREQGGQAISVAGAFKRVRNVHFYANLESPIAPCFEEICFLNAVTPESLQMVRAHDIHYIIWDEKNSSPGVPARIETELNDRFENVREWQSSRLGRLILYEVKK
ncbi:hypothetical protein DENIS_2591 [Desulfonema ishimotonii]|uniref:Glycosyltransferase RgtA/B/C/D-like domain-containing protein n=1 Tax=Desulfonema ishimotonii TaxID=45657 RepID=A0A401FXF6_9BACT|nr:hypothetical protein [Desulfonema ishimotonii]GBC61629.1 hypothetical protein DENIS_2591 [Desulfonema ishimotonii]